MPKESSTAPDHKPSQRQAVGYPPALVAAQNAWDEALALPAHRIEELAAELSQLRAAAAANRVRLEFDSEPGDFAAAMARWCGKPA